MWRRAGAATRDGRLQTCYDARQRDRPPPMAFRLRKCALPRCDRQPAITHSCTNIFSALTCLRGRRRRREPVCIRRPWGARTAILGTLSSGEAAVRTRRCHVHPANQPSRPRLGSCGAHGDRERCRALRRPSEANRPKTTALLRINRCALGRYSRSGLMSCEFRPTAAQIPGRSLGPRRSLARARSAPGATAHRRGGVTRGGAPTGRRSSAQTQ